MAATKVQSLGQFKNVLDAQTLTATYASPPTEGNLLVCLGHVDNLQAASITGWTEAIQLRTGTNVGHGAAGIWYKIAGAGESSDVVLDFGELNRRGAMIIYEFSHAEGLLFDVVVGVNSDPTSGNSLSSGSSAAVAATAILALAVIALRDDNATLAGTSWTNSFTGDDEAVGFLVDTFSAIRNLSGGDGAIESTVTWNGTSEVGTHAIIVFKTPAAAGLASYREATTTDVASADAAASDVTARDVGS
jgi:hypothetical protein